jgi:hypothetical protein
MAWSISFDRPHCKLFSGAVRGQVGDHGVANFIEKR